MRQVSEKRSSLRFPLKFSEFHQKPRATAPPWSEPKPKPTPKPRLVNNFYLYIVSLDSKVFHFNWVGLIVRSAKSVDKSKFDIEN